MKAWWLPVLLLAVAYAALAQGARREPSGISINQGGHGAAHHRRGSHTARRLQQQGAIYADLLAALTALNQTSNGNHNVMLTFLSSSGLGDALNLTNPALKYLVFAPSDAAFQALPQHFPEYPGLASFTQDPALVWAVMAYHFVIPVDGLAMTLGDLPANLASTAFTFLSQRPPPQLQGVTSEAFYQANIATINFTLFEQAGSPASAARLFLSSVYSATILDVTGSDAVTPITAGSSLVYPVDKVLIPPSTLLLGKDFPLRLMDALANNPNLTLFYQLVKADNAVMAVTSNKDLQPGVLFAPTDTAIRAVMDDATLRGLQGSDLMRRILLIHMVSMPCLRAIIRAPNLTPTLSANAKDSITVNWSNDNITDRSQASLQGPGNAQPIPVSKWDVRAGKSIIWIIDGLILPYGVTPDSLKTAAGTAKAGPASSSSSSGISTGAIVGIVLGVVAAVALALVAAVLLLRRKGVLGKQDSLVAGQQGYTFTVKYDDSTLQLGLPVEKQPPPQPSYLDIAGLTKGELFTRETAHQYQWTEQALDELQPVEAGVNDTQLDQQAQPDAATGQLASPVVQLTKEQLAQQVTLLSNGLIGKGGSALVFRGLWPSRFGAKATLAVKVLKDGFGGELAYLESFAYEAAVLASKRHRNVVRMYGYCLEPPTVCIILELLPFTLKELLYKGVPRSTQLGSTYLFSSLHPRHMMGSSTAANTQTAFTTEPGHTAHTYTGVLEEAGPDRLAAAGPSEAQSVAASEVPLQKLTMLEVVALSTDIASGLAFLHEGNKAAAADPTLSRVLSKHLEPTRTEVAEVVNSKVVHRDLKPANILVNSQGVAKISDFGLARQHEHTTVATVHVGAGTLPYMAPELLVGAHGGALKMTPTNRVDIYSLAMMMWEMLSSQPPWKGMSEPGILAAVVAGRRPLLPDGAAQPEEGEQAQAAASAEADLSEVATQAASTSALPAYNAIIRRCWDGRDLRRPRADEVYAMLCELLAQLKSQADAQREPMP